MLLITGLPNAGKTTYSKRYENVIHGDDMKAEGIDLWEAVTREGVVIEGLFPRAETRRRMLNICSRPAVCVFLDISFEECLKREDRGRKEWYLRLHYDWLEPPTMDEGWDEIIVIKEGQGNEQTITTGAGG